MNIMRREEYIVGEARRAKKLGIIQSTQKLR